MTAAAGRPVTEVAVGVLTAPDGRLLLADRPAGKAYAGYWEFPGGKIEPGESVQAALARELREELDVAIGPALPWVTFEFDYPHAYVRLHFMRVAQWHGEPQPREGQRIGWFRPQEAPPAPLLPAAVPVLRWLRLPPVYALSNAAALGEPEFLRRLDRALAAGLRAVCLREPALDEDAVQRLQRAMLARTRAHAAMLFISSRHGAALAERADGVQLTQADLMRSAARPSVPWVGASVHDHASLRRAAQLGCDFALLGPVLPTATHPRAAAVGWHGFTHVARAAPIPVYALGGLEVADLLFAQQAGAHGLALLRAAWPATST